MKIKMLKIMAGPNGANQIGQVVEVEEHQAMDLVDAGAAELVIEKAVLEPVIEEAVIVQKRKRGRKKR